MNKVKQFLREEDGMGTVEVILIIVEICTIRKNVYSVFCESIFELLRTQYTHEEKIVYSVELYRGYV